MFGGWRRLGACIGVVLVMVFSAASVVRAPGVPPVIVANADSATTEATAVPPGTVIGFSGTSSIPGTAFTWFFGDMESATGPTASHAYDADGVIDVTLVGQAPIGTMALDTVRVYIASPTYGSGGVPGAVITATPASLTANEDATFTFDCRDSWPATYNKALLSCTWDFGDHATATGQVVNHAYGYFGSYVVRLVVRDAADLADTETVTVTVTNLPPQPPAAPNPAFGMSTTTPTDDYALEFDWDFGDGTGGANEGTYHIYSAEGPYTVTLTVRDDDGETATATRGLTVANPAPAANAGSAITVSEAQTALFSGTGTDTASDAGSLAYSWTGGTTLPGRRPTQVWYDETTVTKTLQVTDIHTASATSPVSVTVQNRAPYASITNAVKSGSSVIVTGVVHEVGADSLTLTWNWGHGSPPQTSTQTFTNTAGTSPFRVTWSRSLWPEVLSGEALDWRTARFGFITIVNPDGSFVTAFPATQPYITFEANRYAGGLFEFPVKDSNPPR